MLVRIYLEALGLCCPDFADVFNASRCAGPRPRPVGGEAFDRGGRMAATRKDDFVNKVRRALRDLQNAARQIIPFFRKPSRKYAA